MNCSKMIVAVGLVFVIAVQGSAQTVQDETKKQPQADAKNETPVVVQNEQKDDAPATEEKPIELSEEEKADIVKLITLNNDLKTRLIYLLNSYYQLKARTPGVKPEFWGKCESMFNKDRLSDRLAPVYAKHFTPEEIKELIKFYESPVGKKFVDKGMIVARDLNVETNQFGVEVGEKIKSDLDKEGYAR